MNNETADGKAVRCNALLERLTPADMRLVLKAHEGLHDCGDHTLTEPELQRVITLGFLRLNRRTCEVWETKTMVELIDEIEARLGSNAQVEGPFGPEEKPDV